MTGFRFSSKSTERLIGVHPELILVASRALLYSTVDFAITDGVRSIQQQLALFEGGKSKTKRSKHITGDAIDVAAYVDGKLTWDWKYYEEINTAFQKASDELGIPIIWGGNWQSFKDGVHFERGAV